MIIDAHVHIGNSFWGNFSPEFLLNIIGDKTCICSNLAGIDAFSGKDEYAANKEMLDASAKYLSCMGLFYWSLGILTVTRMVTQGLGYSGRTVFSGATEMVARAVVSLGFVGTFGYTAICFADQAAWIAACCYSVPTCLWCVKKSIAKLKTVEEK